MSCSLFIRDAGVALSKASKDIESLIVEKADLEQRILFIATRCDELDATSLSLRSELQNSQSKYDLVSGELHQYKSQLETMKMVATSAESNFEEEYQRRIMLSAELLEIRTSLENTTKNLDELSSEQVGKVVSASDDLVFFVLSCSTFITYFSRDTHALSILTTKYHRDLNTYAASPPGFSIADPYESISVRIEV